MRACACACTLRSTRVRMFMHEHTVVCMVVCAHRIDEPPTRPHSPLPLPFSQKSHKNEYPHRRKSADNFKLCVTALDQFLLPPPPPPLSYFSIGITGKIQRQIRDCTLLTDISVNKKCEQYSHGTVLGCSCVAAEC